MKDLLKKLLQSALGFNNYLFVFSLFKVFTLRLDKKENDFFHFLRLIPSEGVILDIGANIGIMAVHLSKEKPGCRIHCFEPVDENSRTLNRVLRFFGVKNVSTHFLALGNQQGTVNMVMPVKNKVKFQGLSHVIGDGDKVDGRFYTVEVKKLDDAGILEAGDKVVAIKLDVENYEYNVLLGAESILRRDRPVIYCELWDNENRQKCLSFARSLGYEVKVLAGKDLAAYKEDMKTQNFFLVPSAF